MKRWMLHGMLTVVSISLLVALSGTTVPVVATPQAKTYVVNSGADTADANPGDGVCAASPGHCTLRAAIQEANLDSVPSIIHFAYAFQGTHAIPGCNLPALTEDNTTIDASAWWDAPDDRPGVELTGAGCEMITIYASGNKLYGLLFGGSGSTAIHITAGGNNIIGGAATGQRNVFTVGQYGVWLQTSGTNNTVTYNYFGTVSGDSTPGGGMGTRGVFVQTATGTTTTISHNLIVGQSDAGVYIWADGVTLSNNIIGVSQTRSKALPNKVGIMVAGKSNTIGPSNTIAGNTSYGIELYHADGTVVIDNDIGLSGSSLGNGDSGVYAHVTSNAQIGQAGHGNVVDSNGGHGIQEYSSTNLKILDNELVGNAKDGIYLEGCSGGTIGGDSANKRNVIYDNTGNGIRLNGSSNATVIGNYIGLRQGAFDGGNGGEGVRLENGSHDNTIGGMNASEGNWIGYNHAHGVLITGNTTHDNYVLYNTLGAPINWGWEATNGYHGVAIYDGAYNNYIGGLGVGNTILSSGWSGVAIVDSSNNSVLANYIGINRSGNIHWGNAFYGVNIVGSGSGNSVTLNVIAYNGTHANEAGVRIDTSQHNMLSLNSIHDNGGPGIELVNGGNNNIPAPSITQASCSGPVSGNAGGAGWTIEIFSDNADEGRVYEGTATADSAGHWSWNGKPQGPHVTATKRNTSGDTSSFSIPYNIGPCLSVHLPLVLRNYP